MLLKSYKKHKKFMKSAQPAMPKQNQISNLAHHRTLKKDFANYKRTFWCHRLDQKSNEIYLRISALASKKSSNQKSLFCDYVK